MLRLDKSGIEIAPETKVLKRSAYAALIEAEEIIAAARAEAEKIRSEVQGEYDRQKEQGYQDGMEKANAEQAERMVEFMERSARYFAKVEDVLVDVVMRALRKVIGDFDQRDVVARAVHKALENTQKEGAVTVRVSPAQADVVQDRIRNALENHPQLRFLEVLPDSRLPADGCILETEVGIVDATLETQLKAIEKVLIKAMK